MSHTHDETHYTAGFVAPEGARYTLDMVNQQGAGERTTHSTKAGVRKQIRTWDSKNMTCIVADRGELIYEGKALGF